MEQLVGLKYLQLFDLYDAIHIQQTDDCSTLSGHSNIFLNFWDADNKTMYYTFPFQSWCGIQFKSKGNDSLSVRIIWGNNGWGKWYKLNIQTE